MIKIDTKRSYEAVKQRGVLKNVTFYDFIAKFESEIAELYEEKRNSVRLTEELADVITVGLTMAEHYGIDIEKAIADNIVKNESRRK